MVHQEKKVNFKGYFVVSLIFLSFRFRVQALIDLKTVQRKEQIVRLKSKLASLDQEGLWKGILCKSYEVQPSKNSRSNILTHLI